MFKPAQHKVDYKQLDEQANSFLYPGFSDRSAVIVPRTNKNLQFGAWRESFSNAVLRIQHSHKAQFSPADLPRIVTLPDELVEDALESFEVKLRLEHRFIETGNRDKS